MEMDEVDAETYEAFAAFFRGRGLKMNKATWTSLSREAQQAWDNIPQQDKNTILRSRAGMSPSNPRSNPQGTPSNAPPSQPPSALQNPSNQRQVDFHEVPDHAPSIGDQYQTNFSERVTPMYDVNHTVQDADNTRIALALSKDTFYSPNQSDELNIFNILTSRPQVTTPNDTSSAATGESNGSRDIPIEDRQQNSMSSLIRQLKPSKQYTCMALLIDFSVPKGTLHEDTWGDHTAREYIHPHSATAEHMRHLLLQYVTWQLMPALAGAVYPLLPLSDKLWLCQVF